MAEKVQNESGRNKEKEDTDEANEIDSDCEQNETLSSADECENELDQNLAKKKKAASNIIVHIEELDHENKMNEHQVEEGMLNGQICHKPQFDQNTCENHLFYACVNNRK